MQLKYWCYICRTGEHGSKRKGKVKGMDGKETGMVGKEMEEKDTKSEVNFHKKRQNQR